MPRSHNNLKTHCPYGHPYAGANLYTNPTSGKRFCRACKNARALAHRTVYPFTAADRAAQDARDRARYQDRAAQGLCRRCGVEPVPTGWACASCRERKRWWGLQHYVAGHCLRCGALRDRVKARHCAACRLKCRVESREYVQRTGWVPKQRTVSDLRWRYLTGEVR